MKRFWKNAVSIVVAILVAAIVCGCNPSQTPPQIDINYSFEDDHLIGLCQLRLPNVVELKYGSSYGTGIVYTVSGDKAVIVTNNHLSGGAAFDGGHVRVRFADETAYRENILTTIGYDSKYDVAFLECATVPTGAVDLRGSRTDDNRMGQRVLAIGNGMGTGLSAAEGIIAQPNKIVTVSGNTVPTLQVSVPINAGMSGSPLFNMKGELIGINFAQTTFMASDPERPVDGVGYTIPIAIVESLYLAATHNATGGAIPETNAVQITKNEVLDEYSAHITDLDIHVKSINGKITVTQKGALATVAVEAGDVIVKIGETNIATYRDLCAAVLSYGTSGRGAAMTVTVKRGEATLTFTVSELKKWGV